MFDHVHAGLAALTELLQYKVYLQSSPHQAAALLAECDGGSAEQDTKTSILQAMRLEWSLVIEAENSMKFHRLMQSSCPHTKFVYYGEVMSSFEKELGTQRQHRSPSTGLVPGPQQFLQR